jgi:hypothetical protein
VTDVVWAVSQPFKKEFIATPVQVHGELQISGLEVVFVHIEVLNYLNIQGFPWSLAAEEIKVREHSLRGA